MQHKSCSHPRNYVFLVACDYQIVQILMVFLARARRYCLGTENPIAHFFRWLYMPMIIDKACER